MTRLESPLHLQYVTEGDLKTHTRPKLDESNSPVAYEFTRLIDLHRHVHLLPVISDLCACRYTTITGV